jgi:hypothetical protein
LKILCVDHKKWRDAYGCSRFNVGRAPPFPIRLLARCSFLTRTPARLMGLGVRPEHVNTPSDPGAARPWVMRLVKRCGLESTLRSADVRKAHEKRLPTSLFFPITSVMHRGSVVTCMKLQIRIVGTRVVNCATTSLVRDYSAQLLGQ